MTSGDSLSMHTASSLQEALQLPDATLDSVRRLTALLYEQGKTDAALELCRGLVALHPHRAAGWSALGAVLTRLERHDEAVEALDRALELDPRDTAALVNRAECRIAAGDNAAAAADLDRAIELDPRHDDPAANRARQIAFAMYAIFAQCVAEGLDRVQLQG